MNKDHLIEKIEECREEMISLSITHDLTSEAVIASSVKLDQLINTYQKHYYKDDTNRVKKDIKVLSIGAGNECLFYLGKN